MREIEVDSSWVIRDLRVIVSTTDTAEKARLEKRLNKKIKKTFGPSYKSVIEQLLEFEHQLNDSTLEAHYASGSDEIFHMFSRRGHYVCASHNSIDLVSVVDMETAESIILPMTVAKQLSADKLQSLVGRDSLEALKLFTIEECQPILDFIGTPKVEGFDKLLITMDAEDFSRLIPNKTGLIHVEDWMNHTIVLQPGSHSLDQAVEGYESYKILMSFIGKPMNPKTPKPIRTAVAYTPLTDVDTEGLTTSIVYVPDEDGCILGRPLWVQKELPKEIDHYISNLMCRGKPLGSMQIDQFLSQLDDTFYSICPVGISFTDKRFTDIKSGVLTIQAVFPCTDGPLYLVGEDLHILEVKGGQVIEHFIR